MKFQKSSDSFGIILYFTQKHRVSAPLKNQPKPVFYIIIRTIYSISVTPRKIVHDTRKKSSGYFNTPCVQKKMILTRKFKNEKHTI